jgi:hypothetical protein
MILEIKLQENRGNYVTAKYTSDIYLNKYELKCLKIFFSSILFTEDTEHEPVTEVRLRGRSKPFSRLLRKTDLAY